MKTACIFVLAGALSSALGCSSSSHSRALDLRAVRAALGPSSGILAPFRPAALGTKRCTIGEGGPVARRLAATCDTRVVHKGRLYVVIFSEQWRARDFRGSGAGLRKPKHRSQLHTSWIVEVGKGFRVKGVKIRGDFPPQLVR